MHYECFEAMKCSVVYDVPEAAGCSKTNMALLVDVLVNFSLMYWMPVIQSVLAGILYIFFCKTIKTTQSELLWMEKMFAQSYRLDLIYQLTPLAVKQKKNVVCHSRYFA